MKLKETFELYDYSLSLKRLVFLNSSDENIKEELIFESVFFVQIPDTLNKIKINIATDSEKEYVANQNKGSFIYWKLQRVYVLEDDKGNVYYIGAGRMIHRLIRNSKEVFCNIYKDTV